MKRAVSISLGSSSRNKRVKVVYNEQEIEIERIGTDGDVAKARQLFLDLDGKVDAMSLGGMDLCVRMGKRDYPIRDALKLVKGVTRTPVVDGRALKYVLERRVVEFSKPVLEEAHFEQAIIPTGIDRIGLAEAVSKISDRVVFGDLMFTLGIPIPIWGMENFKWVAKILLPVIGFLPLSMILPPGAKNEALTPKHDKYWRESSLVAGDLHYIRKYGPADMKGKIVITNTTTDENLELMKSRGVRMVITTTPRYEGRSFGVNMMEAVLTAYAGKGRALKDDELNSLVDELNIRPSIHQF